MGVIRQGPNMYVSDLEPLAFGVQRVYDSREAAEKYDGIAAQAVAAREERGQEILDQLPTEILRDLNAAVEADAARTRGYATGEVALKRVLGRYPQYFDIGKDSQTSLANQFKVRGYLEAHGAREGQLPTEHQLDGAIRALISQNALYLKPGAEAPELSDESNEADLYAMPLSDLERKMKGWS